MLKYGTLNLKTIIQPTCHPSSCRLTNSRGPDRGRYLFFVNRIIVLKEVNLKSNFRAFVSQIPSASSS